jgi:pilus assembly protein FimV
LALAAAAVFMGTSAPDAHALALGRVTVQSALGEPLRAQVDIPEINAEELSSLKVAIASPAAFRAAGMEFSPAIANVQITLQRHPDGRYFLRMTSDRPVNDPFIDLILEANWSSGRIVRDYTMLFDPPSLRQSAPPAPVAAQVQAAPQASAPAPARAPAASPAAAAPRAERAPAAPSGDGKQVTVQAGDTAGRIAAANKPPSISLDQMLVALLRANPDAFIGGNINRVKSGAVLQLPDASQAGATPQAEARQTIVAQSRDFNEFRRRLAEGVPATRVAAADRQASGRVQTQVQESKAAAPAPDKLTLSKGAVQGKATEDKIARDRAAQAAATRVAELNKNISDLNRLGTASGTGTTPAASAPRPGVAVPVAAVPAPPAAVAASAAKPVNAAAPVVAAAASPAAAASASAPAAAAAPSVPLTPTATTPLAAASAPAAVAAPVVTASAPAPAVAAAPVPPPVAVAKPTPAPAPAETSLLDDLLANPIVPAAAGGLLALLIGLGFYRARQRKKSTQVDSSFLESRLQPDSFFGASGGQRIDTAEGSVTGSSMVYSPSQLDAAGDVDPVAEADVYLAYGRDLQAEEILKEALRTSPQRVAIHAKLLEIYAKRRDAKAFELVAAEAHSLTQGEGPDWEHICELGHELDPTNPMYRPGGQPMSRAPNPTATMPMAIAPAAAAIASAAPSFATTAATPAMPQLAAAPANVDLDLDLDFSLDDPAPAPVAAAVVPPAPAPAAAAPLDMDFGDGTISLSARPPAPAPARLDAPDLTLPEGSLSFDLDAPPAPAAAAPKSAPAPAPSKEGMIEFDLGALSLDLNPADAKPQDGGSTGGFDNTGGDPLATKLALAEEFNAIGDPDGARSLAEEVVAEASGDLKSRAQRFLAEIR